jgi:hypothetical protein
MFNPDTNDVRVINGTGVFIWKLCDGSRDLFSIVADVEKAFDDAPHDLLINQVKEFLDNMVANGFIGMLEE